MGNSVSDPPEPSPSEQSDSETKDHLLILAHGLHGTPEELSYICSQLQQHPILSGSIQPLRINANRGLTEDGVDTGGRRVAEEVLSFLEYHQYIRKLSFVGHSLGGLYCRFAINELYKKGVLEKYELVNYISLVTPHLGSREHLNVYGERMAEMFIPRFAGRTGEQLFLMDDLLVEMSSVEWTRILGRFRNLVCYANLNWDLSVHYYTASMLHSRPHSDEIESLIVKNTGDKIIDLSSLYDNDDDEKHISHAFLANDSKLNKIIEIYHNLRVLRWKRFGVIDRGVLSHIDVIVKYPWITTYGHEIVQHMLGQMLEPSTRPE